MTMLIPLGIALLSACKSDPPAEAPKDFCGVARASSTTCKEPSMCDTEIAAACAALPKALSESAVGAAKDCLESGICGVAACVTRSRNGATTGAAHEKLADDFCRSCAPNVPDCNDTFYKRGSKSAGLIMLPYADPIVSAVDDACTGQAGCQAKFTTCATDVITRSVGQQLDSTTADCVVSGFRSHVDEAPIGPDGKPQVVTCTPASCTGCCREDKCEKGDNATACGTGGRACEICSATSKCTAGACKEPCGPNTCAGCCAGDDCIRTGTDKTQCGEKGGKCADCGSMFAGAGVCSNHSCIDGSCQATCTNGCCSAAGCQPGNTLSACGTGGEGCVDCGVGRTCTAATCQLDRTSLWDVYISFAVVPDKNKNGESWDPLGGAPDPYCKVFTSEGTSVHSGQTSVVTDSTVPFWAETPVKGVKASELLANTSIEIWDSDLYFDDYMGGCALPLTPAIFDGSLQSQVCPATASGVEVKIYFRINPHVN
jgi:hypothetical protein